MSNPPVNPVISPFEATILWQGIKMGNGFLPAAPPTALAQSPPLPNALEIEA